MKLLERVGWMFMTMAFITYPIAYYSMGIADALIVWETYAFMGLLWILSDSMMGIYGGL